MISQSYSNPIMNTGAVNLSEVKERFLENVLREVSSHLTDDQYNFIRTVIVSELSKVEILDPLRGYDERLEEECSKLLDLFLKAKELEGLSPKSIRYYEGSLKRLFEFLDNKPISQITADDIRGFLSSVLDSGSSTRSANNLRRIYSSFFNWCFVEDHILKSPMLKVRPLKERKEVKKEFADFELEQLRKTLNEHIYNSKEGSVSHELALRNKAIFELLLASGIRVGELIGLNYADVDFTNNTALVTGKGNKERRMFFTDKAKVYLEDYLNQRRINTGRLSYDDPLFTNAKGVPRIRLGISGVERKMRELGAEAGVKKVHPHRFRRTFATRMIRKGMNLEKVQKLLGHENADTTMIYVNVSDKGLAHEYDKFVD